MKVIDKIRRWWENEQMVWHLSRGDIGWFYNRPHIKEFRKSFNKHLDRMLKLDLMTKEEYTKTKTDGVKAELEGMKELVDCFKGVK